MIWEFFTAEWRSICKVHCPQHPRTGDLLYVCGTGYVEVLRVVSSGVCIAERR